MTDIDAPMRYASPAADRTERDGSVALVVLLALALAVAAVALAMVSREMAEPFVLAILAALAVVGVFCLFAGAVGILHFGGRHARNDVTKAFVDNLPQGALIADGAGRVLYANESYRDLLGLDLDASVPAPDRAFTGNPHLAEAIFRLSRAAQQGRSLKEEFRLPPPGEGEEEVGIAPRWFRISVQPMPPDPRSGRKGALTVWQVDEITMDRAREEASFAKVQAAIAYLDSAPAGFFTADVDGTIEYLNATLAQWLGLDLSEVAGRQLKLAEIMSADSAALIAPNGRGQAPGATRRFDLDLVKDPARVKVVTDMNGRALYFSRAVIPHRRDADDPAEGLYWQHLGIYAYTRASLTRWVSLPPTPAELVEHRVHLVEQGEKRAVLSHLLREGATPQTLVFTRTKHGANRLAEQLERDGIDSDAIHGNKSQGARTRTLKRFKDNELQVLVATDIAARGLYFLDSRTTADSVAETTAREHAVPTIHRDVFLDHVRTEAFLTEAFERSLEIARHRGYAVVIAHPHDITLDFLEKHLAQLPTDVTLTTLGALVSRPLPAVDRRVLARLENRKHRGLETRNVLQRRPGLGALLDIALGRRTETHQKEGLPVVVGRDAFDVGSDVMKIRQFVLTR